MSSKPHFRLALLGAGAALSVLLLAASPDSLQAQQPKGPAKSSPPAKKGAPSAPAGQRTETVVYDVWTVTCRETIGGTVAKVCSAQLTLQMVEGNRQQNLGAWIIGRNTEGKLLTVMQAPMFQTQNASAGLLISKGVDLKLGTAAVRHLAYAACEPQRCEASIVMDDAMIKEVTAAPNAMITLYGRDGTALNINVPSIKGIDKAVAAIGR